MEMYDDEEEPNSCVKVSITKIVSPVSFWAKLYQDSISGAVGRFLKFSHELNEYFFYHSSLPVNEISYGDLNYKDGELVAAKDPRDNCWYRGRVAHTLHGSSGFLIQVFLLDKGEFIVVNSSCINYLPESFHDFPFQAIQLKLPNLYPFRLHVNSTDLSTFKSVHEKWDSACNLYVEKLVKDRTYVEVRILEKTSLNDWNVLMFLEVASLEELMCLNEELVKSEFALCLSREEYEAKLCSLKFHVDKTAPPVPKKTSTPQRTSGSCLAPRPPTTRAKNKMDVVRELGCGEHERKSSEQEVLRFGTSPKKENPNGMVGLGRGKALYEKFLKLCAPNPTSQALRSDSHRTLPLPNRASESRASNQTVRRNLYGRSSSISDKSSRFDDKSFDEEDVRSLAGTEIGDERGRSVERDSGGDRALEMQSNFRAEHRKMQFAQNAVPRSQPNRNVPIVASVAKSPSDPRVGPSPESARKSDALAAVERFRENTRQLTSILPLKDQRQSLKCSLTSDNSRQNEAAFNSLFHKEQAENSYYHEEILVYGNSVLQPVKSLQEIAFNPNLKRHLREDLKLRVPNTLQSHAWPAVLRLRDVTVIGPRECGKTISYLLPVVSSVLNPTIYENGPSSYGPLVFILCAKASSARRIFDYLKLICWSPHFTPVRVSILDHQNSSKLQSQLNTINGCDILISTPHHITHLLETHQSVISFRRLSHFVLDEAHLIFEESAHLLDNIMQNCVGSFDRERSLVWQIILCSERWNSDVSDFMQHHMNDPIMCISSFLEAAVFVDLGMETNVCKFSEQDEILKRIVMDNIPQKIAICTASIESAVWLQNLLGQFSVTMLIHPRMNRHQIEIVNGKWKGARRDMIIVIVDDSLPDCDIKDAGCLIHYDLPAMSKTTFANRFQCVFKRMKGLLNPLDKNEKGSAKDRSKETRVLSYIFVTDLCSRQAPPSLLNYLERFKRIKPPAALRALASGSIKGREEAAVELCPQWKEFGRCRQGNACEHRHAVDKSDAPLVPKDGEVEVLVTSVSSATRYHGRVTQHVDQNRGVHNYKVSYLKVWQEMQDFYVVEGNRLSAGKVEVGDLCTLHSERENEYHRVKVARELVGGDVTVFFVDTGRTLIVQASRLLKLPDELKSKPFQSVEIFVCNLKPIDNGFEWDQEIIQYVHALLFGQTVTGKVQLALNSTLWLQPLVKMKYLDQVKMHVTEFSVEKKLKENRYATSFPEHMATLNESFAKCFNAKAVVVESPKLMEKQKPFKYAAFQNDACEEVGVAMIQSPSCFYVRSIKFEEQLNELKEAMNANEVDNISETITRGHVYKVYFSDAKEWNRGRVDEVRDDGRVLVYSVDHGDKTTVSKEFVVPLREDWIERLPGQAVECSLYGIEPVSDRWAPEATTELANLVYDSDGFYEDLLLKVVEVLDGHQGCRQQPRYSVLLYKSIRGLTVLINEELVRTNRAKFSAAVESDGWPTTTEWDAKGLGEMRREDEQPAAVPGDDSFLSLDDVKECAPVNEVLDAEEEEEKASVSSKRSYISKIAHVKWFQSDEEVTLKFLIHDIRDYVLKVQGNVVQFKTIVGTLCYQNRFELFSKVHGKTNNCLSGNCLTVVMKKELAVQWPYLLSSSSKVHWLSFDFDHLDDSGDEVQGSCRGFPQSAGRPKVSEAYRRATYGDYHSDRDSSDGASTCSDFSDR